MFTKFLSLVVLSLALVSGAAQASVVGGSSFEKIVYLDSAVTTSAKSAANSGRDYASAKGFLDGDLLAIPANVVIDNVFVVVDTAISGLTAFNIGDDDAASGFIASSSPSGTLGALGLKYYEVDYKGSYLKGGATSSVSVLGKYYSATGKEVKLDVTGTASAGKARVFISGRALGKSE